MANKPDKDKPIVINATTAEEEKPGFWGRLRNTGRDILGFGKPPQIDPAQATTPNTGSSTLIAVVIIVALAATIYFVTKKAK